MSDPMKTVALTCHGHTRPVVSLEFSTTVENGEYFLISGAKDNNPQMRDGMTGDWVGTFIGHKGAVFDATITPDTKVAATASADFTAKIWSTLTGECLDTLQHEHVVRAVAFPHAPGATCVVATGGNEKKLRIFDFSVQRDGPSTRAATTPPSSTEKQPINSYEIGVGSHHGTIRSIVWNIDYNILTTACEDRKIRWFDLRAKSAITTVDVEAVPSSMELCTLASNNLITVSAGKSVYIFDGTRPGHLQDEVRMQYDVSSAAINPITNKLVTGGMDDTWIHVYDMTRKTEDGLLKGHHGPIWTLDFSPDGKLFGSGSEDGTIKLWKACREPYGLWK